jgi:hypothetical protein
MRFRRLPDASGSVAERGWVITVSQLTQCQAAEIERVDAELTPDLDHRSHLDGLRVEVDGRLQQVADVRVLAAEVERRIDELMTARRRQLAASLARRPHLDSSA